MTSAIIMALFVCAAAVGMASGVPLTPSMYTLEEGAVEGRLTAEYLQTRASLLKETIRLNVGILPQTNLRIAAGMMQSYDDGLSQTIVGDSTIGIWRSLGSICEAGSIGYFIECGLATAGRSMINQVDYATELGSSTLSIGIIGAFSVKPVTCIISGVYVVMPAVDESIFDGINLNVADGQAWKGLFGLNPASRDSMLYHEKLGNDIVHCSVTAALDLFPSIYYVSFIIGNRINNTAVYGRHGFPLLYRGYNDTFFAASSLGMRYFFNETAYVGAGALYNIVQNYDYSLRYTVGIEASIIF